MMPFVSNVYCVVAKDFQSHPKGICVVMKDGMSIGKHEFIVRSLVQEVCHFGLVCDYSRMSKRGIL